MHNLQTWLWIKYLHTFKKMLKVQNRIALNNINTRYYCMTHNLTLDCCSSSLWFFLILMGLFWIKWVKQDGGSDFKQLALILGRILHYFTKFDQCFNGRQFWWRLVIKTRQMGRGKGWGGAIWMEINIPYTASYLL